jgi:YidC/Oxa1 family membrane protein insertase
MAKTLISSPSFLGTPLPSLHRNNFSPNRTRLYTKVHFSFHQIPPIQSLTHSIDVAGVFARAEGLLYTLADAAVTADAVTSTSTDVAVQKNGGWFGFISDAMEFVLKVIFTTCAF